MLYLLLGAVVIVSVLYLLLRSKGVTFSSEEKAIIAKLEAEETRVFENFKAGKEDVIAEYEKLKGRVNSLVSLKAKLPAPPQVVAPVPVAAALGTPTIPAAPVVAVAPVVESAPNPVDPNAANTVI